MVHLWGQIYNRSLNDQDSIPDSTVFSILTLSWLDADLMLTWSLPFMNVTQGQACLFESTCKSHGMEYTIFVLQIV